MSARVIHEEHNGVLLVSVEANGFRHVVEVDRNGEVAWCVLDDQSKREAIRAAERFWRRN